MSNAQERGMRDFWLVNGQLIEFNRSKAATEKYREDNCPSEQVIHVREVDPSAPDFKKLAEDLAEALESISGKFSCTFCVKNMAITDKALEGEK